MRQRDLWRERLARALSLALKAVSMARPQGRQSLNVSLSLLVSMSRCLMSPQVSGLRSQVSHSFPRPAAPMARHRITIGPRASSSAVRALVRAPKAAQRFAIGPRAAQTFRNVARAPSPLHEPRTTDHEPRTTNHEPRTTNHEPRITSHEKNSTFFKNPLARSPEM